ncbi:hypothetical protein EYC08_19995 [Tabrizicola sp. WMC-M-20]|nr:hypothetical protein EYC08_19995 [Tabrizicola sp. WMC-M-20]
MPWFLSKFGRNDEPSWGSEDADIREGYMRRTYRPDPSRYPLKVRLSRPRKTLPDFTVGPWASLDVVSERFKRLVEDLDPVTQDFVPLDVAQPDGTSADTRHFIFRPKAATRDACGSVVLLGQIGSWCWSVRNTAAHRIYSNGSKVTSATLCCLTRWVSNKLSQVIVSPPELHRS